MENYAGMFTQAYTMTEILHFKDGSSAIHVVKELRCFAFDAVTRPCSAWHLAAWQDINPSIVGVTFQYDHA